MIIKMKKLFLSIVLLCFSNIVLGQDKSTFKLDKLFMYQTISENEKGYQVLIEIINKNDYDIFIPKLISDELNFFNLGNKLYIYYGLSFSLLGEQNPDSQIDLIRLKSKGVYTQEINIIKKSKIEFICVGLEYLSSIKSKYHKTLVVGYEYYNLNKTSFYVEYHTGNVPYLMFQN